MSKSITFSREYHAPDEDIVERLKDDHRELLEQAGRASHLRRVSLGQAPGLSLADPQLEFAKSSACASSCVLESCPTANRPWLLSHVRINGLLDLFPPEYLPTALPPLARRSFATRSLYQVSPLMTSFFARFERI